MANELFKEKGFSVDLLFNLEKRLQQYRKYKAEQEQTKVKPSIKRGLK